MKLFHFEAGMNIRRIRVLSAGKGLGISGLARHRPQWIGLISKDRQP
ncbi:hypothetical protein [Acidiphilium sp. PM]|nr:hypothetical protein [Acidiphilium sp. PM]